MVRERDARPQGRYTSCSPVPGADNTDAVLLLGVARRIGYAVGAVYASLVWAVGEGFGGPYQSGATDIGTGIIYAIMFISLLVFAPPARRERFSLDRVLVAAWRPWRFIAEPHAVDRVHGAPQVEPVIVGEHRFKEAGERIDGARDGARTNGGSQPF